MERSEMTSGAPPCFPTGGEVVGWLVSALRFADLRAGTGAFSESTAKRVARAAVDVSDEKRSEVLRALVHRFFSDDYLASRGLDRDSAQQHNMVVLAGLEGALSTWDALVGRGMGMGRDYGEAVVKEAAPGVFLDATLRIGAYLACFRKIVPASRFAWKWCSKPGIQMAFQLLLDRSAVPPSDNDLIRSTKIARNTLRDIKSGKSIPQEETILRLANAFSKQGVQTGDGDEAEICALEMELRLACLVASIGALLGSKHPFTMGIRLGPKNIAFFASDLRRYDPSTLATIIAQGVESARWPEIHARMKTELIEPSILKMGLGMKAHAERVDQKVTELLSSGDESAAYSLLANEQRDHARLMRESMEHIPGWEKGAAGELHRFFEDSASFWECLATGKEPPAPRSSGDTMMAKGLCEQVVAPWLNLSVEEKTALIEKAVETDPACAHVRLRAGIFYHDQPERLDDAIRHLKVAVMQDPDDPAAAILLAFSLVQKNQLPEALEVIGPAASGKHATPMALLIRGLLLLDLGRPDEAEECFLSILEREPKNPGALHGLADVCRERGERQGEARYRRRAELHGGSRPIQAFPKVG